MANFNLIINGQEETMKSATTNMKAFQILVELSNPDRQLFSDFCMRKRQPASFLSEYLYERGASQMGERMGDQIKTVIFDDLHHNKHKTSLLSAVGQAYIDLCLGVSIAEYCMEEDKVDLPYGEYVSYIKKSIDLLITQLPKVVEASRMFPIKETDKDKFPVLYALSEGINPEIAKKRVQNSVDILLLFKENKIKYNEVYEDVVQDLRRTKKHSEDDLFFSHVVTVLRNKSDFTQEQMSFINEAYENRFTEDQQKSLLSNVPKVTPSVEDTQAYFFKSTEKKDFSIFDVDFGAIAE